MWRRPVRVLAVDGGGVRGILPAHVLAALEEMTGRCIADLFDLLVGTSIGGIGVLALARPGPDGRPFHTAADVREFFTSRAPGIFPTTSLNWPRSLRELEDLIRRPAQSVAMLGINLDLGNARHSPEGLRAALVDCYEDDMLGDVLTDVVITAFDVRAQRPRLFRSAAVRAGSQRDRGMVEVAMAASAPPTYFPAVEIEGDDGEPMVLVDGGVFAKTPALIAYLEGVRLVRESRMRYHGVEVVSVGTGSLGPRPELTLEEYSGRTWYRLAQSIFEAAQAGQSAVTDEVLGEVLGDRYWRFDLTLPDESAPAIDDASPQALAALQAMGQALVEIHRPHLERLAQRLVK